MRSKGAGPPWEELSSGNSGEQESRGARVTFPCEAPDLRPPPSAQPFPATGGQAAEGTWEKIAFLWLLSHIPKGLCSNSDFPNIPGQPEVGLA